MENISQLQIDDSVQNCTNSIANTLELLQSCTKPWKWGEIRWLICCSVFGAVGAILEHEAIAGLSAGKPTGLRGRSTSTNQDTQGKDVSLDSLLKMVRCMGYASDMCPWSYRVDGLVQERCNSSALAMEFRLSCTNLSMWQLRFCVLDIWCHHIYVTIETNDGFTYYIVAWLLSGTNFIQT